VHKVTYQYRLYPTKKQIRLLNQVLDECRWLYNHLLEQRKTSWEQKKKSLSLYDQINTFPKLKVERESLSLVHSQVLQNVAVRIDLAFQAFFRRVQSGEKPGYPRFRGKERYDSFTFPQSGFEVVKEGLRLSKVGVVPVVLHRKIKGTLKTLNIRRSPTGKWYASFACEFEPKPMRQSKSQIGIDVGLESFATLSNGEQVAPPNFFRQDEKALAKAQRKLSKAEKGSRERCKRKKIVSRIHERIAFRRKNFAHQLSRKLVNRFGFIAVEDISVNRMLHNHCLSKSISDAAWSRFLQHLSYKAAYAGREFVKVNPAYTSQDCSRCGHREEKFLGQREHRCSCCGYVTHRDHNAAQNILRVGTYSQASSPRSPSIY
jgi:putative transposase